MKKIMLFTSITAIVLLTSCENNAFDCQEDEIPAIATVRIKNFCKTKATGIKESEESKVHSLQVLIFGKDNTLESYASNTTGSDLAVACTTGEKAVWAFVNSEDMSSVKTKDEILKKTADLKDFAPDRIQMVGKIDVIISSPEEDISIDVHREVARITLNRITRKMIERPLIASKYMTITGIYVINAAGDYAFDESPAAIWYNKMGGTGDIPALLSDSLSYSLADQESYEIPHSFYVCPNYTNSDTFGGEWSPRHTRLVVEAEIEGRTCYYPITLPVIEANKTYTIDEIILTRMGSDNPDIPAGDNEIGASLHVMEWESAITPFRETE